jgi:small-conductance mechanosensitive channel
VTSALPRRFLAVAVGVMALAVLVRFQLIEPQAIGIACSAPGAPWWCLPREALVLPFHFGVPGVIALALAVVGFLLEGPWARRLAWIVMPVAAAGLILYNATWSAPAIVLALLTIVRGPPAATATPSGRG